MKQRDLLAWHIKRWNANQPSVPEQGLGSAESQALAQSQSPNSPTLAMRPALDGLALAAPLLLLWALYWRVTDAWWLSDDPGILKSIIEHGIARHFFEPTVWRQFSTVFVTPWVQLSLGLDYYLFGLNPRGFYFHHLISFSLVIAFAYTMLRNFFSALAASSTLCIFVASVPSAAAAQFLMVRHYVEGLGLTCLAVCCYVWAVRREQRRWAWLSGIFYLLACTTKEVYVPLVGVLPMLAVGAFKARVKMALPAVLVAAGYVLWRAFMLGPRNILMGYSDVLGPPGAQSTAGLPIRIAQNLGWSSAWPWLALAVTLLPGVWMLWSARRSERRFKYWLQSVILVIVLLVAGLAPIVPVLRILTERYLFLPFFLLSIAIGAGLSSYRRLPIPALAAHGICLLLGLSWLWISLNAQDRSDFRETTKQFRLTGQFVLSAQEPQALLLSPMGALWFYAPLQWLRTQALKLPPGPRVCYDLCACAAEQSRAAYQYQNGKLEPVSLTEALGRQSCDQTAPLTIEMLYRPGVIHWKFGPDEEGQYLFAGASGPEELSGYFIRLKPAGKFALELREPMRFIVKSVSKKGHIAYSPLLTMDPQRAKANGEVELRWSR